MLENQDLRPRLFAKTYVLASPASLPHPPLKIGWDIIKKKGLLAPYTPGVFARRSAALIRACES